MPTFADDSGLEVFSLGGAPGVHSKRWAGATGSEAEIDAANNAELLRRLAGAPESRRLARYRCVLFYVPSFGGGPTDLPGRLYRADPRGAARHQGLWLRPLLLQRSSWERAFGEATAEEKDAVSHRGRALRALAERLVKKERPSG